MSIASVPLLIASHPLAQATYEETARSADRYYKAGLLFGFASVLLIATGLFYKFGKAQKKAD